MVCGNSSGGALKSGMSRLCSPAAHDGPKASPPGSVHGRAWSARTRQIAHAAAARPSSCDQRAGAGAGVQAAPAVAVVPGDRPSQGVRPPDEARTPAGDVGPSRGGWRRARRRARTPMSGSCRRSGRSPPRRRAPPAAPASVRRAGQRVDRQCRQRVGRALRRRGRRAAVGSYLASQPHGRLAPRCTEDRREMGSEEPRQCWESAANT